MNTNHSAAKSRSTSGFYLVVQALNGKQYAQFVQEHLRRARLMLRSSLAELTIVLVDDHTMSKLHRQYLHVNGPTDVLTFPLDADSRGHVISGEIVVCVPEARRQAKSRRIPVKHELLLYALHGMLHLSGFDDKTDRGFRSMHAKEDEILTRLGVGAVYAATPARPRRAPGSVAARGARR